MGAVLKSVKRWGHLLAACCLTLLISACDANSPGSAFLDKPLTSPQALLNVSSSSINLNKRGNQYSTLVGDQFNDALLAELYNQLGEGELSSSHYQSLVSKTGSIAIFKRGTEIAARSGKVVAALRMAKKWIQSSPDDLEANQYLTLLLLRNEQYVLSAKQLQKVRFLVENNIGEKKKQVYSKGLKFIGTLLSVESNHKKAFIVFETYLEKYPSTAYKAQQNMVSAALAMKAEKYQSVINALTALEGSEFQSASKLVLMKAKAYKKLNNIEEAVKTMQRFIDTQKSSDSDQLELVRLLIINKQRNLAKNYLMELVEKHPDNNDLLKSLIALEIDQHQYQQAKQNIKQLRKAKEYINDAEYFLGEIMEAEGDFKNALHRFKNVKQGTLLKRARDKVLVISRKLARESSSKKINLKESLRRD